MRQHGDSEEVAPLILEIHGGAVLDGGVVELLDVRPLPAAAPGDTLDERLRLLERPRVVVFAPPAVGARASAPFPAGFRPLFTGGSPE